MKKKRLSFYYIMVMLFCQFSLCFSGLNALAIDEEIGLTVLQKYNIITSCEQIGESLKQLQKDDSEVRNYVGSRYDLLLNNFITPFNTRLINNNFNANDANSQAALSSAKQLFATDYISYQQSLENLVNNLNCKTDPVDFYQKLTIVREKRSIVQQDVLKLQSIASDHLLFVKQMEAGYYD